MMILSGIFYGANLRSERVRSQSEVRVGESCEVAQLLELSHRFWMNQKKNGNAFVWSHSDDLMEQLCEWML